MNFTFIPPFTALIFTVIFPYPIPAAESADEILRKSCAECHALTEADRGADFSARADRLGPPLDYAGDKFRRDWLSDWLQKPTRIRPAGVYPARVAAPDADGKDRVDQSLLPEHPALSADQAEAVADRLMTFRSRKALIENTEAEPVNVPRRMGELNFSKFKGCVACHLDAPGRGGLSGPELYTAWRRATPEYLHAYISDPAAWDRHSLMPGADLNDREIGKLLGYLRLISEEHE